MIEARLRCDECGDLLDAGGVNSRQIRVVARSKGWTKSGGGPGRDFCPACSDTRAKSMTEQPDMPGTPIPGFPGYTLDKTPDGSWGVRSARAWHGRPAGAFLKTTSQGRICLPDANGKVTARYPGTWAEYVLAGVVPASQGRKLSDEQARSVFRRYHDLGETPAEISRSLGLSVSGVNSILRGAAYADVTADLLARYPATRPAPIPRARTGPLQDIPGVPIPGFPGYTLDKQPDGSWGIRTARSGEAGQFMRGGRNGESGWVTLRSADGKRIGRSPKAWAEYVFNTSDASG